MGELKRLTRDFCNFSNSRW